MQRSLLRSGCRLFTVMLTSAMTARAAWTGLTSFPAAVNDANHAGACMASVGTTAIYAVRGGIGDFQGEVYKYDIASNAWRRIATGYHAAAQGADMALGRDGLLYTVSGGNQVWSGTIDPATDTIVTNNGVLRTPWPSTIMGGGGMTLDVYGRYFYCSSGEDANGAAGGAAANPDRSDFMRYDLSNRVMQSLAMLFPPTNQLYNGGAIVCAGQYIYLLHGVDGTMFRYDPNSGAFAARASLPAAPGHGSSFVYDGGAHLIGTQGGGSKKTWIYHLLSNTWQELEELPSPVGVGGGVTWNGQHLYVLCGGGATAFYRRDWTPTATDTTPPYPPQLLQPLPGEYLNDTTPEFVWLAAQDPDGAVAGYVIQIDATVASTTSTNFTPPAPLALATHTWRVCAIDTSGNTSAWSETRGFTLTTNTLAPDFCCVCLERVPKLNRYRVQYNGFVPRLVPGTENDQRWPNPGEPVTYRMHVYNSGMVSGACAYAWYTNNALFAAGVIAVDRGRFASNAISFAWPAGAETLDGAVTITFVLNPSNSVPELSYTNNILRETTRGLSLSFYMAQEHFNALSAKRNRWGTYNAVDWLRIQLDDMHAKFAQSIWPATPSGILERVRIDRLVLTPNASMDAALAADPYLNNNDGRWAVYGDNPEAYAATFGTTVDYGLIHEISHQLGLIDVYQYDVEGPANTVWSDGAPALFEHVASQHGMMRNHGDTNYSEFSSLALNSQLSRRRGYYGDFQFLIPRTNILRVLDVNSNALAGATIECFRRGTDGYFSNAFVVCSGTTDVNGCFVLPSSGGGYATSNGYALAPHPFGFLDVVGGNILLARIRKHDAEFWYWFECIAANIAYWRGQSNTALYTIATRIANDAALAPPRAVSAQQTGDSVTLGWLPPAGTVSAYRIYTGDVRPYDAPMTLHSQVVGTNAVVTRNSQRRYATVAAVYADGREGSAAPLMYLPNLPVYSTPPGVERYVAGIAMLSNEQRLVCIARGGEEQPIWQRPNGAFVGMFSSVHNHLEPLDAAWDARLRRVIVTDMPDSYDPTGQRIIVLDENGRKLFTFGSTGSAPGQFNIPGGLAVDSQSRILVADRNNNRIQAFSANGAFITAVSGLSAPNGIAADNDDRVLVADTGNKRVLAFTWSGANLLPAGTFTGPGFSNIVAITHGESNEIFVADAGYHRITQLDANGAFVTNYLQPNDGSGGTFNAPRGLACGPGNYLVVSDSGNRRVVELYTAAPRITALTPEDGGTTLVENITLALAAVGNPWQYRAAQDTNVLAGAAWQPYAARIPFTFTAANYEVVPVYVQVRNRANMVSETAQTTVLYIPEPAAVWAACGVLAALLRRAR